MSHREGQDPRNRPQDRKGLGAAANPARAGEEHERLTDVGNARRFARANRGEILYCHTWNCWMVWDGVVWHADQTGEAMRRAKDVVRNMYREAGELPEGPARAQLAKHATSSERSSRLEAMIKLARSEESIPVLPDEFDADSWVLNLENGVLDLSTGELREHDPANLCMKQAPIRFSSEATCPRWDSFLREIFDSNDELISFIGRAVGYFLTGSTKEQKLFFLYGRGANGKTTFVEVVRALLGTYAVATDSSSITRRGRRGVRNDVARLNGARLATAQETDFDEPLDEPLVKQLTGGDTITARFLYSEAFDFKPRFKLLLAGNHKPVIRGTDDAIWRRIVLIPFEVTIPEKEQDRDLLRKLLRELPGILAWAVRGCLDWRSRGLLIPRSVLNATAEYRTESDFVGDFIADCCVLDPAARESATDLNRAHTEWARENGGAPASPTFLGRQLAERGLRKRKSGGRNHWQGIRLRERDSRDGLAPNPEDYS